MRTQALAALAAFAAGTIAVAQAPAPPIDLGDRAARWREHASGWRERKADFAAMHKRRADDIALLIGLRPDQRAAFDALEATMAPPHHGPERRTGPEGRIGGPGAARQDEGTEARIARMSARIDERSADAKTRLAALRSFYAGLSPEQRLRFDALDRLRHDHRGGGGQGWHHGGPGGHDMPPPPPAG